VGGSALDATGVPLLDEKLDEAKGSDVVLLGTIRG
jgi:3-isopropylmalate dehydrogenase